MKEQAQLDNLDNLKEQKGYFFKWEEEENEQPLIEKQDNETPLRKIRNVPREWGYHPNHVTLAVIALKWKI